ncbi:MAG: SIS domain-containing protein [Oscillospiraceae bacterium]|nr:SIS domain-containing protein [Oscillospiraceae bacterium]
MDLTYKEMLDTWNALEKTTTYLEERWGDIDAFLRDKSRFVFIGCGSSYSIAKSMAAICNMSSGVPAIALAAGDVLLHAERYKKAVDNACVVVVSRSGRTSELMLALDGLKAHGCRIAVAALVCADDTPLGAKSDLVLSTPWAFDESVCQTRCVTNFYFIAAYVAAKITDNQADLAELQLVLREGPGYMAQAEILAKKLAPGQWDHAVVLADGELEGLAEEGSLVFKEVCQLPSNYYHLLDVRHGPMVLVGEKSLALVALGTTDELEYNLLRDLRKKGAEVVAFSDVHVELEDIIFSCFGRPLSHTVRGIPFIVLCQMIAYYKAKVVGADPDQPTGLSPWIAL